MPFPLNTKDKVTLAFASTPVKLKKRRKKTNSPLDHSGFFSVDKVFPRR
jgi:hypothetical protein